ncbi:hypothetical protein PINS_up021393, partial [Pythium insidiosum]
TRSAIAEQLRRGEELRRKMRSMNSDDEDDMSDSGDDEADGHLDARRDYSAASSDRQARLRAAEAAREGETEAEKLLREIKGEDTLLQAEEAEDDVKVTEKDKAAVAKALPQGALQTSAVSMDKGLSARASGGDCRRSWQRSVSAVGVERRHRPAPRYSSVVLLLLPRTNPVGGGRARRGSGREPVLSGIGTKSKKHKKKRTRSCRDSSRCAQEAQGRHDNRQRHAIEVVQDVGGAADEKSKTDELSQDELVRRAFAFADEDENEIAQEKEAIAAQDTNAKKGAEIAKLKSYRQKKLAEDTKKQVLEARLDSKMERVLINEKKDKRAAKFAVQEVPYPFTSREEYEMAMRNPLGSDWNTAASTNKLTAPKLIKRAGQMIDPLKLSKEDKKQAKKELSKKRKAKF